MKKKKTMYGTLKCSLKWFKMWSHISILKKRPANTPPKQKSKFNVHVKKKTRLSITFDSFAMLKKIACLIRTDHSKYIKKLIKTEYYASNGKQLHYMISYFFAPLSHWHTPNLTLNVLRFNPEVENLKY